MRMASGRERQDEDGWQERRWGGDQEPEQESPATPGEPNIPRPLLLTRRLINARVQMPNLMEHHDEGLAEITRAPASITLWC